MNELILSLFPGADLLGMAFELEGFCVVQGPDVQFGRDVREFHPPAVRFDGIIGGPPCQAFSRMRHLNPLAGAKHGNLIPEFERVVSEAQPSWFVMENVPEAPAASVTGYETTDARVNNRWLGEEQNRMRRFSFGHRGGRSSQFYAELTREFAVFESPIYAPAVCASGGTRAVPVALGGSGKIKSTRRVRAPDEKTERSFVEARRLQGLPADFLDESPFTVAGKIRLVGNGVPIPMGRAVARAVKRCLGLETEVARVG